MTAIWFGLIPKEMLSTALSEFVSTTAISLGVVGCGAECGDVRRPAVGTDHQVGGQIGQLHRGQHRLVDGIDDRDGAGVEQVDLEEANAALAQGVSPVDAPSVAPDAAVASAAAGDAAVADGPASCSALGV